MNIKLSNDPMQNKLFMTILEIIISIQQYIYYNHSIKKNVTYKSI